MGGMYARGVNMKGVPLRCPATVSATRLWPPSAVPFATFLSSILTVPPAVMGKARVDDLLDAEADVFSLGSDIIIDVDRQLARDDDASSPGCTASVAGKSSEP